MTVLPCPPRSILVGVTGRAGVGKDTFAAAFLAELARLGRPGHRLAMADKLREVSLALFGSRFETQEEKASPQLFWGDRLGAGWSTGRGILQQLGTEVFRAYDRHFWCHCLEWTLQAYPATLPFIVSDIRFDNEARLIRSIGGLVVLLTRPDQPPRSDDHASEDGVADTFIDERYITHSVAETELIAQTLARRCCLRTFVSPVAVAPPIDEPKPRAEDLTPARPAEEAAP